MKRTLHFLYLLSLVLFFSACRSDEEWATGSGFLISLSEEGVNATTRSTPSELGTVAENFNLKIKKTSTGATVYDDAYTSELIPATTGPYTVTATYGSNAVLAWDSPYYYGKEDAEVTENAATTVSITCAVANSLLSVNFNEKFDSYYSDYGVRVTVGNYSLEIRKDNATASAYFQAGSTVELTFFGTLSGTTKEVSASLTEELTTKSENYNTAGIHTKITLSPTIPTSGTILTVDKVEVEEVNISETIPLEWLTKPQVSNTGFDDTNTLEYTETADLTAGAAINYTTASAVQDVAFTLAFNDAQYSEAYNGTYTLSTLTDEQRTTLENIGIVLPTLDGTSTSGAIDLSNLVPTLLTNDGETVENTITVNVKANNRWSSTNEDGTQGDGTKYTIKVVKPEFSVSVYPGNIWTKEFTVNALMESEVTSGGFSKLSSNMSYQYSADGINWTTLDSDLRADNLQAATAYYIRGLYRESVAGNVTTLETYPLTELTNGGLEGATISYGQDQNVKAEYGAVYTWTGWSTLNELTCDKCTIIVFGGNTAFNSRSGTRPSSDIRSGSTGSTSAWIMTMGYGWGGTSGPEYTTPSELFLGTLSDVDHSNDTATKNYGISYSSHPTGVKFYYKYTPYDSDRSDIYVRVMSDDTELGKGVLQESNTVSSFTEYTMRIEYNSDYIQLTPNKLELVFKSGFNTSVYNYGTWHLTKNNSNSAEPSHRGSELYIDDVSLVYDK